MITMVEVEQAIQQIAQYNVDSQNMITQSDAKKDGGDTANRIGIFYYMAKILGLTKDFLGRDLDEGFEASLKALEIQPGIYIRHPTQVSIFNVPEHFSRDQQTPISIAMSAYKSQLERLTRLANNHFKRFGKYQNTDISGPQHWGFYSRRSNNYIMYPYLILSDIGLVGDSIVRVIKRKNDPSDTSDDLDHSIAIIQAYEVMPTPLSWLARKIYNLSNPMEAINLYFGKEAPALNVLINFKLQQIL